VPVISGVAAAETRSAPTEFPLCRDFEHDATIGCAWRLPVKRTKSSLDFLGRAMQACRIPRCFKRGKAKAVGRLTLAVRSLKARWTCTSVRPITWAASPTGTFRSCANQSRSMV